MKELEALTCKSDELCGMSDAAITPSPRRDDMTVESLERETRETGSEWSSEVHRLFRAAGVSHVSYVPDAGHTSLINLLQSDPDICTNVLTSEEEGVAVATGVWLGGKRPAILMQSSGVGNCINMLSLPIITRTPLLMLVTMRGEWAEFNPWQNPMGKATQASLQAIGVTVLRVDNPHDLIETIEQAIIMAYEADQQIAVLIGQRMLGKKKW